ncbi:MAG: hypothetical protein QMC80_05395 [Thermoplasmatales archaeon]|nr:hypothetical protein [Thermoplasmatales archaeon]
MNRLIAVLIATAIFGMAILSLIPTANSEEEQEGNVNVGIYLLSIGNFELNRGTYVTDFYLFFRWNENISMNFEFMNGRINSKDKILDEVKENGEREVWYRINANLFIEPKFSAYPFDSQELLIVFEDTKLNSSLLKFSPLLAESGIDENVKVSGFKVDSWQFKIEDKEYKWGEKYSRTIFSIKIVRDAPATAVKTILPPIIFCVVSGLSFFFKSDKITHRLGLGTSMLISAVMFHISQTSSLPPLAILIMIDKIMIAAYSFLASSLIATVIIYIDEEYWKDVDYTKIVNRAGAIITLIIPFIVFGLLTLIK